MKKNKEDLLIHRLNVRVDQKMLEKIRNKSNELNITEVELIRQAISYYFKINK